MSNALAKREAMLPAVPNRKDIEALGDADLWSLAERAEEISGLAWEVADERLREWVEVDGLTSREVAKRIGRDQSRVVRRCARLEITFQSNRGGARQGFDAPASNETSHEEVIDAEVVEDDPGPRPASQPSSHVQEAPDPGPRVKCPTCGHLVAPNDIHTWKE